MAHRRGSPVEHSLSYPMVMTLLDLDELPQAFDRHPLWSARRPAPVSFRAGDHLHPDGEAGPRTPVELADRARRIAGAEGGAVRLLSMPRMLGVGFNPVSFFFLYEEDGDTVRSVIAEVTNTPWGERHAYVAHRGEKGKPITATFEKRLHVSPFHPMEQSYEMEIGDPGDSLRISIRNRESGSTVFAAGLALERHELSRSEMSRVMLRYPPAALTALARIYWHGLRLKLKGVPHHPHPEPGARTG